MDSLYLHSHCHVPGLALWQVLLRSDQLGIGEQSSVTLPETLDVALVVDDLRERYNKSEQSRTDENRRCFCLSPTLLWMKRRILAVG